jgi:hypothetical protein
VGRAFYFIYTHSPLRTIYLARSEEVSNQGIYSSGLKRYNRISDRRRLYLVATIYTFTSVKPRQLAESRCTLI